MQPTLQTPTEPGARPVLSIRSALVVVLTLAVLLLGGYLHGVGTGRWSVSHELQKAVARLDRVPATIGDWRSEDRKLEDEERVLQVARIKGIVFRKYTNASDGSTVSMLLVCGLPGPIAVHTPDICFTGSGYTPKDQPARVDALVAGTDPPPEFMRENFDLNTPEGPMATRAYWSWSTGERWQAPDHPRWKFASKPYLYKLYLTCGTRGDSTEDPATAFVQVLLPALHRVLAPEAENAGGPTADRKS